jgi:hypothetical protein
VHIAVDLQALEAAPRALHGAAQAVCGGAVMPLRLWPDARPGRFSGTWRADAAGDCEIVVTVNDARANAPLRIDEDWQPLPRDGAFAAAIAAQGGVLISEADDGPTLRRVVEERVAFDSTRATVWPMRAPFWLLAFTACLGAEWWLRRRRGLR